MISTGIQELTEAEFAGQQRSLGRRIHEHDGVFWEEVYPFYCKPAFPYRAFDCGVARPARLQSLLGYSHQVVLPEQGNGWRSLMVLDRECLDRFSLQKLPSKKRNQVRRAMEQCVILPITDMEAHLERIREINIVQAVRQAQGAGAEGPASRYIAQAYAWRAQIRREFNLEVNREWWGAYVDETLVAYLRTYQVDGIRVIQQAKADTTYFKHYPMDALYFTVLRKASENTACRCIINGSPLHESVNHFKEQFLFKHLKYPCFSSIAWLVKTAKIVFFVAARLRRARSALDDKGDDENCKAKAQK